MLVISNQKEIEENLLKNDCGHPKIDPMDRKCEVCGLSERLIVHQSVLRYEAWDKSEKNEAKKWNEASRSGQRRYKTVLFDFIKIPNMLFRPFMLYLKLRLWFEPRIPALKKRINDALYPIWQFIMTKRLEKVRTEE